MDVTYLVFSRDTSTGSSVLSSHCTLANTMVVLVFEHYLRDIHTEYSVLYVHSKNCIGYHCKSGIALKITVTAVPLKKTLTMNA